MLMVRGYLHQGPHPQRRVIALPWNTASNTKPPSISAGLSIPTLGMHHVSVFLGCPVEGLCPMPYGENTHLLFL